MDKWEFYLKFYGDGIMIMRLFYQIIFSENIRKSKNLKIYPKTIEQNKQQ